MASRIQLLYRSSLVLSLQLYITMTRPLRIWLRDHICAPTNYVKLSLLSSHSKCMFSHVTFCVQMENRSSTAEYRCPSANCSTRDATDANYSSKHWRPALEDISSFLVDSRSQQIRLLLPLKDLSKVPSSCPLMHRRCQPLPKQQKPPQLSSFLWTLQLKLPEVHVILDTSSSKSLYIDV